MNCHLCNKPLPSPDAVFGPHDAEVCAACYLALDDERAADFLKPSRCVVCGKLAADEKIDAGYPGLYHCGACRAWFDAANGAAWIYERKVEQR